MYSSCASDCNLELRHFCVLAHIFLRFQSVFFTEGACPLYSSHGQAELDVDQVLGATHPKR